jgi:glycosyltransferase involved in cell wall biosynthesis
MMLAPSLPDSLALPESASLPAVRPPTVSVIMIFLNEERFLAEAVESVFAQTFPDWELILVDDGSTDTSSAMARAYAERYPEQVRYIEHPDHANRGTAASRNLGARHARGRFLAFLDADDVYNPENLARQVEILETTPEAGMVMGKTLHWFNWPGSGAENGTDRLRKTGPLADGSLVSAPNLVPLYLSGQVETPGTCSVLIRREVFDAVGAFDESLRVMFEDAALFYKIAFQTSVYVDGACSALYRQHPASACHAANRDRQYHPILPNPTHQALLTWLQGYAAEHGFTRNPQVQRALGRALWPYHYPLLALPVKGTENILRTLVQSLRTVARRTLPFGRRLHSPGFALDYRPAVGRVDLGSLRRVTPISRDFGYDRGNPVDRTYIERFLEAHKDAVRGRVMEIGDNSYTRQFGGDRVTKSDVLHVNPGAPGATIIGDLSKAGDLPTEAFDCIILTQTLHLIYDFHTALEHVWKSLKPGGVLLATVPGISHLSFDEWGDRWFWSFTPISARRLFGDVFGAGNAAVESHGNVLTAISHLHGIAAEELRPEELSSDDPHYPVIIAIRATRNGSV